MESAGLAVERMTTEERKVDLQVFGPDGGQPDEFGIFQSELVDET
jgi:hypothetical protein